MNSRPLEDRVVSRKTPGDGKLEITKPAAERLQHLGKVLELETPAGAGTAELISQPCTCRGEENPHQHWFLVSSLFRSLVPGSLMALSLTDGRIVLTEKG